MERAIDGNGHFLTPDGLTIRVALAIVFGDGAPRIEIRSLKGNGDLIPVQAIDRAAKAFLYELSAELRRRAYRERPFVSDPKPKDRPTRRGRRRA
jgi:hypothetical protein